VVKQKRKIRYAVLGMDYKELLRIGAIDAVYILLHLIATIVTSWKRRTMTSFHSIKTDLINADVQWKDEEVVVDQCLVTSRGPADIPAFCKKIIEEITEGRHYRSSSTDSDVSATFN
jgi:putative intracellular protease/amidase